MSGDKLTLSRGSDVKAPIDVATRRQLFIDERFIAAKKNIERTLNQPDLQQESLLGPNKPWEVGRASAWSSIVHYEGRFYFWYDAYEWDDSRGGVAASDLVEVQMAFSRDGIEWHRPWRQPVIPPGTTGSLTAGQIFPVQYPIVVGDQL